MEARGRPFGAKPVSEKLDVGIDLPDVQLAADLALPFDARGLVVFAHGSGSGRKSPRNQKVAELLNVAEVPLGTLLVDLLSEDEARLDAQTAELRFDIELLAARVAGVTDWLMAATATRRLPIGYFGASTGAAAALVAAAARKDVVRAVVSRGGRPDLAGDALAHVLAPTLLVVGSRDPEVLALNERARNQMRAPCQLEVVAGAGHLFEEPGALAEVERLAADWFGRWLSEDAPHPH
jgi:putative phosphoribosyl transferase